MDTEAANKESKNQCKRKTLGSYWTVINWQNSRRSHKLPMFRFPNRRNDVESGFKTLDVKTLDTFIYRNCTTINYAPVILMTHNSQSKKRLKHDALPTLFDVPNPPSKITPSWSLKMIKPVAKKKVKANNVGHSDKMSTCENVEKCDTPQKRKLK